MKARTTSRNCSCSGLKRRRLNIGFAGLIVSGCAAVRVALSSIVLRLIENFFGDERENQLLVYRRDARYGDFTQQPFDVIFLGVAETAESQHRLEGGIVSGARAKEFSGVRFRSAGLCVVVKPRCLVD